MTARTKNRPVRVAPKGWSGQRAARVLAVEGLSVSERTSRIVVEGQHADFAATRKRIVEAIKK